MTVILDDINDQIPKLPNISDPLIEISEITNEVSKKKKMTIKFRKISIQIINKIIFTINRNIY